MDEKRTPQPKKPYLAPTLTPHGKAVEKTRGSSWGRSFEVYTWRNYQDP